MTKMLVIKDFPIINRWRVMKLRKIICLQARLNLIGNIN